MLKPDAIIATWISDDSKRGIMLQANGDLVEVTREGVAHVWSPPNVFAALQRSNSIGSFVTLLDALTDDSVVGDAKVLDELADYLHTTPEWDGGDFCEMAATLIEKTGRKTYNPDLGVENEVRVDGPDRGDFGGLIGQQPY